MSGPVGLGAVLPREAAESLRAELGRLRISADVHEGHDLALVSVWVGLVVWCDGQRFWWRTSWNARRRRFVYAWHSSSEPEGAARRVALWYAQLRREGPVLPEEVDHGPR
ncbi:hypothetical protein GCM10010517_71940 [Streptosporangium fragile]|uniref:Uncharacterized protein n=1 Tax=Streptosporangium fragile TaxID=46186 RepID=A0ABN3W8J6_9ACTN